MKSNTNTMHFGDVIRKGWTLVVILMIGCVTFQSCSNDDYIEPVTGPRAEFKAMLETLDWGEDTCYIYGHRIPDVDAVTSAMSYALLMREFGYNCKAKVSSPINKETEFIGRHFGFELPEMKTSVEPQTRLILMDHSDYSLCVEGAHEAIILQKIDHHEEGDILDAYIPYVRRETVGATNTIIYEMYRELGVPIDDETARIMLAGIISDTRNLAKPATQPIDIMAVDALSTQLGISSDSVAWINLQMEEKAYDYEGMTDAEIYLSDFKDYEIGNHKVGIGCIAFKEDEIDASIVRMQAAAPEVMQRKECDMIFAVIDKRSPNPDPEDAKFNPFLLDGFYFIYDGEGAKEVAESIFGPASQDGTIYISTNISRRVIVSMLQEVLAQGR